MEPLSLICLADLTGGTLLLPDAADFEVVGVSTDSRQMGRGFLFVPVRGDRFDGHGFLSGAFAAGACAALVSRSWFREHGSDICREQPLIAVEDPVDALQALAAWHRSHFDIPVIAVTGSSGKTTTKEFIAAVIEHRFHTLKTPGNLNSQVGAPQVLLSLRREHEAAVIELGMNHAGELGRIAQMTAPTIGVITNVGPAHLEFLDTLEGVAQAKGELLDHVSPTGWMVLNGDDPRVMAQSVRSTARLITFGLKAPADVRPVSVTESVDGSSFILEDGMQFTLPIPGEHTIMNALAAIAVGRILDLSPGRMAQALADVKPAAMRMNQRRVGGLHVIMDAYNANPVSMQAALKTLSAAPGRRIAILGDMLELGIYSETAHAQIGKTVAETADLLITVGEQGKIIGTAACVAGLAATKMISCATNEEVIEQLPELLTDGDYVLIKGSRGMKMEEIDVALDCVYGSELSEPRTSSAH